MVGIYLRICNIYGLLIWRENLAVFHDLGLKPCEQKLPMERVRVVSSRLSLAGLFCERVRVMSSMLALAGLFCESHITAGKTQPTCNFLLWLLVNCNKTWVRVTPVCTSVLRLYWLSLRKTSSSLGLPSTADMVHVSTLNINFLGKQGYWDYTDLVIVRVALLFLEAKLPVTK